MSDIESQQTVTITETYISADDGDTVFGKRWGNQLIRLDAEHSATLRQGKYLALDVQNEYIVYLQLTGKDTHV